MRKDVKIFFLKKQRELKIMNTRNLNTSNRARKLSVERNSRKNFNHYKILALFSTVIVGVLICLLSSCGGTDIIHSKTPSPNTGVTGLERKSDILCTPEEESSPCNVEYPVSFASYTDKTAKFSDGFGFCSAVLIDVKNNVVVAASDAEERIYPASLTKIMTLIVAVENCPDLDVTFTMTADILDPLLIENASVAGFSAGEKISIRDMLYGLMLPSGADAAVGLAEFISGSEKEFVKLMNDKVAELGLENTHFENCTGLHHPNHYSTCHELAKILEYALKDELMLKIFSTYQYITAPTEQHPEGILLTSTLFSRMYGNEPDSAFVVGGKTGYTLEAHHCLASFAVSCDEDESEESIYAKEPEYILVTVGSTNLWGPIYNAIDIYSVVSGAKQVPAVIEPTKII